MKKIKAGDNVKCTQCNGTEITKVMFNDLPKDSDIYTIDEFVKECESGMFIDYDGFGEYAYEDKMSNINIKPSHVMKGQMLEGFTHIVWYNK